MPRKESVGPSSSPSTGVVEDDVEDHFESLRA